MKAKKVNVTAILIAVCAVVLGILIAAGVFLVTQQRKVSAYTDTIETAEKYIEEGDYEAAIEAYNEAIDLMPAEEDAYLDLAELYLDLGETSMARVTLRRGSIYAGTAEIEDMLTAIKEGTLTATVEADEETEVKTLQTTAADGDLSFDMTFVQRLETYTYEDYEEAYGSYPEIAEVSTGTVEVVHANLGATFTYANTDEDDDIVDTTSDEPADDAQPGTVELDDLSVLFVNFTGTASLSQLQSLSSTVVKPITTTERTYVELTVSTLQIKIETDTDGNVLSADAWNEITMTEANENRGSSGVFAGVVIDVTTGLGVEGAVVTCKGSSTYTASTDAGGAFYMTMDADTYTGTVTLDGYTEYDFVLELDDGENVTGIQISLSPTLASGTMRLVLEWNAEPQDLDSYLTGTTDSGVNVDIYYGDKICTDSDGNTIAELDVDDTNGYGPETITIYDLNGTYSYYIEDFRSTGTMGTYGATVTVYYADGTTQTISMDQSAVTGNLWNVLTIDHGVVTVKNTGSL